MPKWTYDYWGVICVDGGCGIDDQVHYVSDAMRLHNADIDALTAERDEWQKKCKHIVDMIQPHGQCPCSPFAISTSEAVWNTRNKLYARAVAIAEGKTC